jgi:hypothetical protein
MVKNMCFIYPYRQIYGIFTLGFINHANPFKNKIDDAARDEWLKLMKEAIWTLDWDDENKQVLYNCFPTLASHMQNH